MTTDPLYDSADDWGGPVTPVAVLLNLKPLKPQILNCQAAFILHRSRHARRSDTAIGLHTGCPHRIFCLTKSRVWV